ncbi:hypothetical protein C2125_05255 [Rahnella aquatilis]|nr:hypothetical protein [Rahnella aquatilis]RBQ35580.1 hypothetical protein C2125_05255 [Rahnella aquatilis]
MTTKYKKLLTTVFLVSTLSSSLALANPPSGDFSGGVTVEGIYSVWEKNSAQTLYYYTFLGELKSDCGKPESKYAVSGDANINRLIQMAFLTGHPFKVDIAESADDIECVIKGVQVFNQGLG